MPYDEFEKISEKVVKHHIENKIGGITYCKECHKKHDPLRK